MGNSWFHTFGIPKALGTGHGLPLFEVLLQTIFGPPRFSWGIHHVWMSPFIKFMSARPPLAQPFSKHFGAIHQPLQKRKVYSCWNHRLCCLKPPEKRVLVRAKSRNISAVDHFWWVDYQFFMDKAIFFPRLNSQSLMVQPPFFMMRSNLVVAKFLVSDG